MKFEEKSDLGKLQIHERKDFLAPSKGCVGFVVVEIVNNFGPNRT